MPSRLVRRGGRPVWVAPDYSRSVGVIGDMHFETLATGYSAAVASDLATLSSPLCYVQIGDATDNIASSDFASHDALALAWLNALPAPWYAINGNHDTYLDGRTVAAWETAYGMHKTQVVDVGPFNLVMVGPDSTPGTPIVLSQTTLDWLDAALAAATKPCLVFCHAPLNNTVAGWRPSSSLHFHVTALTSDDVGGTDTAIRTILGSHTSAFAFISGHTHSAVGEPGYVTRELIGGRCMATINCSSINYVGHNEPQLVGDPLRTMLVTVPASGDRVEIRTRDCRLKQWISSSPYGVVATVPVS